MNEVSMSELIARYNEWRIAHDRTDECFAEWLEYEIDARGIMVIQHPNKEG